MALWALGKFLESWRDNSDYSFAERKVYALEYIQVQISNVLYKCFIRHYERIYADETKFHQDLEILEELLYNADITIFPMTHDFFALEEYFAYQIGARCRASREFEEVLINEMKSEGFATAIYNSLG